jgi:hypothetical protein
MKPAVIFSLPTTTSYGYCWRWRAVDGKTDSAEQFVYYHDCLADANANGYSVRRAVAHGNTAPGWRSLTAPAASEGDLPA